MGVAEAITGQVLRVHEALYVRSDGRIGHRTIGVPSLLLRSKGRRTGKTRTNALVYAEDGGEYLLVASNGGADQAPGWLFNVRADPKVEIQIGRERRPATARVVERGDPDYERMWQIVNEHNHNRYEGYQKNTSRPIPVVAVRPD